VADSFDAMTSKRCYKKNMSVGEAQKELRRCVNSQFDEKVVEAFIAALSNNKATDEENSQAAYQINNDEDQQVH
jgi:HD-GYP domain-containing protein (c-di-GMP phosphodiesterase class II)